MLHRIVIKHTETKSLQVMEFERAHSILVRVTNNISFRNDRF